MTIQQTIEKAIEGGYSFGGKLENVGLGKGAVRFENDECIVRRKEVFIDVADLAEYHFPYSSVLLDPLFWQSLGKAMGWEDDETHDCQSLCEGVLDWRHQWHRFIDHLAEGKDAESFFEKL